jgi:hypothetical protein
MTPAQFELLQNFRRQAAEMRANIASLEGGDVKLRSGDADITTAFIEQYRQQAERLEKVIADNDPSGVTA